MDRGKRTSKFMGNSNKMMYMDLKDIIREHALPFLPAKSLFRFQAVCRDWKLQISTHFFAHNQSLCFRTIAAFFYQSPISPLSFLSIDPNSCNVPDPTLSFLPELFNIKASCNGLICCQSLVGDKCYYICNPVTKQVMKLPKPNAEHGSDSSVVLIFEPSLLNFVADYKLVCAFPSSDFDNATEFEVYSSNDGSWKVCAEICFASRKLVPQSGVCAGGVVYWQANTYGIVAFDFTKDRSQFIQNYYYNHNSTLGLINGKPCIAYVDGGSIAVNVLSNVCANTMQMGSKTETWTEKIRFHVDDSKVVGSGTGHVSVLFVGGGLVLTRVGLKIICYYIKTKETKVVSNDAELGSRFFPYVNSLVSI